MIFGREASAPSVQSAKPISETAFLKGRDPYGQLEPQDHKRVALDSKLDQPDLEEPSKPTFYDENYPYLEDTTLYSFLWASEHELCVQCVAPTLRPE